MTDKTHEVKIDLSHLYRTETVHITPEFAVTVREILHKEMVDMQRSMFGQVTIGGNKRDIERELSARKMSPADFNEQRNFLAIESWTLKDATGNDVPLTLENYGLLPHRIIEQIEAVVERLNPTVDDDTKS